MNGKVILITGANGGLGNTVTQTFLDAGAKVVGTSRNINQSDFPHERFVAIATELNSTGAASALVDSVVKRLGRLDGVVHLVGGFVYKSLAETDDETWEQMAQINVKTAFYIAKATLPHIIRNGGGRFIAIGSRAAVDPAPGLGAYSASKAALIALVRTIAVECKGAGITANVLLPTVIDTPANRASEPNADFSVWIKPASLANLILYLASDAGAQITGAVIPVYGRGI
jgi:NAD(P)-dependent dehydrogenase (short-subunit alcohol dehydrogenase family)